MKSQYSLLVGLDWADQEHALCWRDTITGKQHVMMLKHTPEKINEWVSEQLTKHPGGRIAVCLEQKSGAVAHALMGYAELDLFPVNPVTLAKYRETFCPSGAKDDPGDAALLLDLLERHRESLEIWHPDTEETRLLQRLCQDRRKAVDMRTKVCNSLCSKLKEYYSQALQLVGDDMTTEMCCAFLSKWTHFEGVAKARPDVLRKFYYRHNVRNESKIEERLTIIATSRPLTTDGAIVESGVRWIKVLIPQIRALNQAIDEYDQRIRQLFKDHPDAQIFSSLPGAGQQLAPRLLAVFGTDRNRFNTAGDVATLNGVAPVIVRSGKQIRVHWRWHCPKFMRQSIVEFAGHSIGYSVWAKIYYDSQIKKGKKHHAAVRALAFKWIRIIFRCWQTGTPYNESQYLVALKKNGSWITENMLKTA